MDRIDLPLAPPAPPAPRKSRTARNILIGSAVVLAIGYIASTVKEETPRGSTSTVQSGWDYDRAGELLDNAGDELLQITETSAISSDVIHIRAAANFTDQAAMLVGPADAARLRRVSSHLRAAATYSANGDYASAIPELDAAQVALEEYNSAPMG